MAIGCVRVLSEHGLLINTANMVGTSFQEYRCMPEVEVEQIHQELTDKDRAVVTQRERVVKVKLPSCPSDMQF